MKTILKTSLALATTAIILGTATGRAQTAYALADNGLSLIKFNLATPGVTTLVGTITGTGGSRIDGIDFRPNDGLLYAYSQQANGVFTLNLNTAAATPASTPTTGSTIRNLGIDFNPVADRLRLVNDADQNLRINIANGATIVDGALAFAAGDPNVGVSPSLNEAAYTNSDINLATGTTLFYIDPNLDILVSTLNPNAGSLNTIGALGVNTSDLTGFDILSDGLGGNTAYALLTATSGVASLYTVNLTTGAATSVGAINPPATTARPYSLAIVQPPPVPEPGTLLFGFALAGACLTRRARRATPRA